MQYFNVSSKLFTTQFTNLRTSLTLISISHLTDLILFERTDGVQKEQGRDFHINVVV